MECKKKLIKKKMQNNLLPINTLVYLYPLDKPVQ